MHVYKKIIWPFWGKIYRGQLHRNFHLGGLAGKSKPRVKLEIWIVSPKVYR